MLSRIEISRGRKVLGRDLDRRLTCGVMSEDSLISLVDQGDGVDKERLPDMQLGRDLV